jgi:hypothetical protein
MFDFGELA